jgi:hypothetical protein
MEDTPDRGARQGDQDQGEGDYASARRYQKGRHEFARSGRVEPAAEVAEKALDGPDGKALERARKQAAHGRSGRARPSGRG